MNHKHAAPPWPYRLVLAPKHAAPTAPHVKEGRLRAIGALLWLAAVAVLLAAAAMN